MYTMKERQQGLDYYIDLAKRRLNIPSDSELGRHLGFRSNAISHWRTRRSWPDDRSMVNLAKAAGVDPLRALLELNSWRAPDGEVGNLYVDLVKRLLASAAVIILMLSAPSLLASARAQTANKSTSEVQKLYIMRY